MRRALLSLALAGTLLTAAAPAALGHECYIANRSATGDAGALHAGVWVRLALADIFSFVNEFVGGDALTPTQVTWAVGEAIAEGMPADGWVVRSDRVIGEGSANPNLADGNGVDHLGDTFGPQLVNIYFMALTH